MKKLLLLLLFSVFLFADIKTTKNPMPVNSSFDLNDYTLDKSPKNLRTSI